MLNKSIKGEIADNEDHGRDREVCEVVYEEVKTLIIEFLAKILILHSFLMYF